ncbi:unnamed protein product, partial [Onchocerca ochengi]|uniref:Non-specific protein-tyrosine kinase n=1 Tax=Onchocerca ochengi TaxID=42157 RepID=A0A182ENG8_ONCOC
KAFDTIIDLVHYYKNNALPEDATFLIYPFHKPKWFLRHENITYDSETGLIGAGNFCDVFEGKLYGKISVALKISHDTTEESNLEEVGKSDDPKELLMHEAYLMSQFKHPNIVKFHGICYDIPSTCIIMERCIGGSLDNHLQHWAHKITTGERIFYGLEAAKGICYLHENDFIHRDLATRNCLISKYGTIKISDFGLSQLASDVIAVPTKQKIPVRWMAPETIQREPRYSAKSDIWSYGVMLYEIFNNGMKPWPDMNVRQCATNIRHGIMPDMPEITPKEIIRLVNKCWRMDVEKRCDSKYIVRKLKKAQLYHGLPETSDLTISKLENVKVLTKEETEMQEEKNDYEMEMMSKTAATEESIWTEQSIITMAMKPLEPLFKRRRIAQIRKKELEGRKQRRKE